MNETPVCCVHLVDGASGAPMVLRTLIQGLQSKNLPLYLLLSSANNQGPLQSIPQLRIRRFFFRWSSIRWVRFALFLISQCHLFLTVFRHVPRSHVILVNTLLPFGAALAGKFRGQRVIYHVHENRIPPRIFDWFLKTCSRWCAEQIVFVSHYSATQFPPYAHKRVVSNALPQEFAQKAFMFPVENRSKQPFCAGMATYPEPYKGVDIFYRLAQQTPEIHFLLALSSDPEQTQAWIQTHPPLANLEIWGQQTDMHAFYEKCHVILNLTIPSQAIETFGLTALEGMAYGLPALVPPVGGIAELVQNQQEGFCINPLETERIKKTLLTLKRNHLLYNQMSSQARQRALQFQEPAFIQPMQAILYKRLAT